MGIHVLKNQRALLGGYNLTGDANRLALSYEAQAQEAPAFTDDVEGSLAGLLMVQAQIEGYWTAENTDKALYDAVGAVDVPLSFGAEGAGEGDRAFFFLAHVAQYQPTGQVGEVFRFSAQADAAQTVNAKLVRGSMMHFAQRTGAGTSQTTGVQLGAVSATQHLYAALHCWAADGTTPTLDVKVQSDDNSGFTSAVDRVTFSQLTDIGSEWATPVAGAITDDYWRVHYTLGGTSPDFTFAVLLGIQ